MKEAAEKEISPREDRHHLTKACSNIAVILMKK
jgi:hypothetical protein